MEVLITVTRTEPNTAVAEAAMGAMKALLCPMHGSTAMCFQVMLKALLPSVLMTHLSVLGTTAPRKSMLVRKDAIAFIGAVAGEDKVSTRNESLPPSSLFVIRTTTKNPAHRCIQTYTNVLILTQTLWPPVLSFMQHVCVRSPEKADFKRAAAKSVAELCCFFPDLTSKLTDFLVSVLLCVCMCLFGALLLHP
jgi:hypothetical protein